MKKILLCVAAILALTTTHGVAADLPYKAPKVVAPAQLPDWTGFYIGANAGGGIAHGKFFDMDCFTCVDVAFHRGFGEIGGQVGYNWQFGRTVLGVEGDINWASVNESGRINNLFESSQFKMDAFGSIRARAGLAFDRTLFYVTAGPAWGHFDSTVNSSRSPLITLSQKAWRFG